MSRPALSARDRRAIRLGTVLLLPGLVWVLGVSPYLHALGEARDQLSTERRLLQRERALLAAARTFPEEFDAGAEILLKEAERLVPGGSTGEAGAAFAAYVRRLAGIGRVHVKRLEMRTPRQAGEGIVALPLRLAGESDLEGMLTLVQMLETGAQLVHVERVHVEASRSQRAWGASSAEAPEVLTFEIDATGFTLAAPAEDAAADESAKEGP